MSSQKNKFLASAQKFIQKGQFERALRDYEQVVTADPKDIKHRQKLAELLVRCNRREDALQEYETIAKFYEENGFYLKSIAVYKQIQRLDPANIGISLALAALNEKQGMIGNALSEYKMVFDYYEKSGKGGEAIAILRRMQGVDPDNVDIRMKLAETEYAAGSLDSAYQEFTRSALILKNRGNTTAYDRVCHRIQELFPERSESVLDLLSEEVRNGMAEEAIPKLRRLLDSDPENTRLLGLLSDAYRISGDQKNRGIILQQLLALEPGDLAAQKGLIESALSREDLEAGVAYLEKYLPDLMAAGAYGDIERYYASLQNQAPYDVRLLEGLKKLYEVTGESSKMADIQVSLNILSQKGAAAEGGSSDDGLDHGLIDIGPADEIADPGSSGTSWGDEIDLSLDDEVGSADMRQETGLSPAPPGTTGIQQERKEDEEHGGDEFEIDISFELPEHSDLFQASRSEEQEQVATADLPPVLVSDPDRIDQPAGKAEGFLEEFTLELEDISERPVLIDDVAASVPDVDEALPSPWETEPREEERSSGEPVVSLTEEFTDLSVEPCDEEVVSQPESGEENLSDKYAFDGIFSRFKESLDQHVDSGDTETHYNLGIAYMEMGLFDDAIKEFRAAGSDPVRGLDCLTLQGVCCREKGDFAEAESILVSGLSRKDLDTDRILSLQYELGLLYETAGRKEDAVRSFREVFGIKPGFRDTMKKIAVLSGKEGTFDLSDLDEVNIDLEEIK